MVDEVETVIVDILRFAELMELAGLPKELARGCESLGVALRSDPSEQMLDTAREWIASTYQYKGSGSIFDRYVPGEEFGSVNQALTDEYYILAKKLGSFAFGRSRVGSSVINGGQV